MLTRLKSIPWLWRILIRVGTRVGVSPQNWLLLESMSRPWWLYRSKGDLSLNGVRRCSPNQVTAEDIALCERLIAAFDAATGRDLVDRATRGHWKWLYDRYQRPLGEVLERRDAPRLAEAMARMFQEDFTYGIVMRASNLDSWLGSRILSLKSLDVLVSLAEAFGAVPVEGPEQRRAGVVFDGSIGELLARIDRELGFRIDFPEVGAPFGIAVDGRLITPETPEQIYAAARLDRAMSAHLSPPSRAASSVVEIGAGYGAMCYWFLRLRPDLSRYTIVDLPIMNVLQGYFLARVLGPDAVSLYGERDAQVKILPDSALAEVEAPVAVLVNKDSMPEMPYDAMVSYLEWGRQHCDGFFYSYNHEVITEMLGQAAGSVPEAIERVGGFQLIRRDHSWLRRGYAEEIYTPVPTRAREGSP